MLLAISETPGISRGELADILGIAGSSVTKQVQKLITEGFVSVQKDKKFTRYYLMDISSKLPQNISPLNMIPYQMIRKITSD
ncbi:winged helix-turn-helix transcriptional regulator [uncultured Methanospirillum sp.]|uniref:winged helix-turn-helix transcriptional regulator n=1 Tax=uncultured Methanospirillum sp. TaxID=262503 RepID=UPI003747B8FA